MSSVRLSLVIPVHPEDSTWKCLMEDLKCRPPWVEVILVGPQFSSSTSVSLPQGVRGVPSALGRGRQMNTGARAAEGEDILFLHADSRLSEKALEVLWQAVESQPSRGLRYFFLRFADDGPRMMRLNAWGANLRSILCTLPFGDQGFLLRREVFIALNGFEEECSCGEDLLFVRKCRRQGIPVRALPATLITSARKYAERGWLRTTLQHLIGTVRQSLIQLPEV